METAQPYQTIRCAFCKGRGLDPYDVLSSRSRCEVCGGRKEVAVPTAHDPCKFCGGTGSYKTFACLVCRGKGVVAALEEPTRACPQCQGRAFETSSGLPCLECRGRGQILVSRNGANGQ